VTDLLLLLLLLLTTRYVDGQKTFGVSRFDVSEWPFNQPFFLATTYNVGGQLADPNVATVNSQMLIDYIRVYPANIAEPPTTDVIMTAGANLNGTSSSGNSTIRGVNSTAPIGVVDSGAADTPAAVVQSNTTGTAAPGVSSNSTTASQGSATAGGAVKG
jgi:hypothetical protein